MLIHVDLLDTALSTAGDSKPTLSDLEVYSSTGFESIVWINYANGHNGQNICRHHRNGGYGQAVHTTIQ